MAPRHQPQYLVTDVTAQRVLEFIPNRGRPRRVTIRLGRPRRDRKHVNGDWVCPYDITGMLAPCKRRAFGIDGVQALSLAFHIIPAELVRLAKHAGGGEFRFLGEEGISFADGCGLLLNQTLEWSVAKQAKRGMRPPGPKRRA